MDSCNLNPLYDELNVSPIEIEMEERLSLCSATQRLEPLHLRNIVGLIAHGQNRCGRTFPKTKIAGRIHQYLLDNIDPVTTEVVLKYIKFVTTQKSVNDNACLTVAMKVN